MLLIWSLSLQDKTIKEQKHSEKLNHDIDDYFRKKSLQNLDLQSQRYIIQNQKLNRQGFLFANLDKVSSILAHVFQGLIVSFM